jgi:hypothetical protein
MLLATMAIHKSSFLDKFLTLLRARALVIISAIISDVGQYSKIITTFDHRPRKVKLVCQCVSSACLVVQELFAILMLPWLSANILIGFTPKSLPIPTSRITRRNHTASLLAKHSPQYSDSVDESAMMLCRFEL